MFENITTRLRAFFNASTHHEQIQRAAKPLLETGKQTDQYSIVPRRQRTLKIDTTMQNFLFACDQARDPRQPRRLDLFNIYEQVERDCHLIAQITTRCNEVQSEPYTLIDANGRELPELLALIETPWFYRLLEVFVKTPLWGHRLIQFHPTRRDPDKPNAAPEFWDFDIIPWGFVLPEKGTVLLNESDRNGVPFREGVLAKFGRLLEIGRPEHLGILESATPEVIWKRYSRTDWARQGEKLGIPWIFVQTPETDKNKLDAYYKMLEQAGSDLNGVLGAEDKITSIQNDTANAHLTFWDNIKVANEEISKLIVGQTSTSDQKAFAGSAGVHERVLQNYTGSDMRAFYYWANWELLPFLRKYGYPIPQGTRFVWRRQIEKPEEQAQTENANAGTKTEKPEKPKKVNRSADMYIGLPTVRKPNPSF